MIKSCTTKDLMMWMCTSKFELEQEQLELMEQYLPASKVAAIEEERAPLQLQADFEPVSYEEEDDAGDIQTETQDQPSKRQCTGSREGCQREGRLVEQHHELDDETEHPLPRNDILTQGSKRVRGL
jgi:hypothetical protein